METEQWSKRWFVVFGPLPHNTQSIDASGSSTFLKSRFTLIGIRSSNNLQEKATTFDGAGLFQASENTLFSSSLHKSSTNTKPSNFSYVDLTEKHPSSSNLHLQPSSSSRSRKPINSSLVLTWDLKVWSFSRSRVWFSLVIIFWTWQSST